MYLLLIAVLLIAIVIVLIIGLGGRETGERTLFAEQTAAENTAGKKENRVITVEKEFSAEIIQEKLNDMGVLVTQEYAFTEVMSYSSVKKLFDTIELGFTETSYVVSYEGKITAGVDFAGIAVDKDDEVMLLTVHLPKSEIESVDIDPHSFKLHSEKSGFGNPLSVSDVNTSLVELEETATEKAVADGLLLRADKNARVLILNFIGSLVDTTVYTVEFVTD